MRGQLSAWPLRKSQLNCQLVVIKEVHHKPLNHGVEHGMIFFLYLFIFWMILCITTMLFSCETNTTQMIVEEVWRSLIVSWITGSDVAKILVAWMPGYERKSCTCNLVKTYLILSARIKLQGKNKTESTESIFVSLSRLKNMNRWLEGKRKKRERRGGKWKERLRDKKNSILLPL